MRRPANQAIYLTFELKRSILLIQWRKHGWFLSFHFCSNECTQQQIYIVAISFCCSLMKWNENINLYAIELHGYGLLMFMFSVTSSEKLRLLSFFKNRFVNSINWTISSIEQHFYSLTVHFRSYFFQTEYIIKFICSSNDFYEFYEYHVS